MPRISVTVPTREIATIYAAHAAFANQGGDFARPETTAGRWPCAGHSTARGRPPIRWSRWILRESSPSVRPSSNTGGEHVQTFAEADVAVVSVERFRIQRTVQCQPRDTKRVGLLFDCGKRADNHERRAREWLIESLDGSWVRRPQSRHEYRLSRLAPRFFNRGDLGRLRDFTHPACTDRGGDCVRGQAACQGPAQ